MSNRQSENEHARGLELSRRGFMAGSAATALVAGTAMNGGLAFAASPDNLPAWRPFLPVSNRSSSSVVTFDMDTVSDQGLRMALTSLQGLVNRRTPRLFYLQSWDSQRNNHWMLDYYVSKGYVKEQKACTDPYQLIADFQGFARGLVVWDPSQDFTANAACNAAGVEDLIMVTPDVAANIDLPVVIDLRGQFASAYEAALWSYDQYWDRQSRQVLGCLFPSTQWDFDRDYYVQHKIHVLWIPAETDAWYSPELIQLVQKIFTETPLNIPLLGFQTGVANSGEAVGIGEFAGVQLAGEYGKFTLVESWAGSYSYHSGLPVDPSVFNQVATRRLPVPKYDPSKTYVAITMIESGDSPGYFQYGFEPYQWSDPTRGTVPYSYGLNPCLRDLMPALLGRVYETATPNDYLFSAISGAGYMYPLEGYGTQTKDRDATLSAFYARTSTALRYLDMDGMGLYSHTWTPWLPTDDPTLRKDLVPQFKHLRTVLADMGRNDGTTTANANYELSRGVSIHHCLTRWPTDVSFTPTTDPSLDAGAVAWLSNEIATNATPGALMHCMAYSWAYGPRRIQQLAAAMEPQGYVFLTAYQLDRMWRAVGR